jgi:hypothetical protein
MFQDLKFIRAISKTILNKAKFLVLEEEAKSLNWLRLKVHAILHGNDKKCDKNMRIESISNEL